MPRADRHRWAFTSRFRRHAFGWRSQPAILRVREAVAEIKNVARADAVLAADGAVVLIGRPVTTSTTNPPSRWARASWRSTG
jgi:hypothetical protein